MKEYNHGKIVKSTVFWNYSQNAPLQVAHVQCPIPFVIEILAYEPSMTVMRSGFRAKEASTIEHFWLEPTLDLALRHQLQEVLFIYPPIALFLLVSLQQGVGWRQQRLMHILNVSDLLEDIGEIIGLCEACKLRCVVQSHVDDLLYAGVQQPFKKAFCIGLGEPNCRNGRLRHDLHSAAIGPPGPGCGSVNATFLARSRYAVAIRSSRGEKRSSAEQPAISKSLSSICV